MFIYEVIKSRSLKGILNRVFEIAPCLKHDYTVINPLKDKLKMNKKIKKRNYYLVAFTWNPETKEYCFEFNI
ncbi:hypothetical protein SAMN04489735_100232 [Aneurinibacillus thermoaerophilus]|uniref:Uncharacterized protein n=1 Tax=Aneurinibacillus thermoaerophilus TaxID=143495 RepID=A0A1G7WQR9_ANETH|nr:hypothetical protein [Aneurinibacillus thermoaerophilus]SDG73590.1 hypothetical protein SAMN04489735_100232 [Aneurinibacillus thermoaerophilus]